MANEILCWDCDVPITGSGPTGLGLVLSSYLLGAEIPVRVCRGCLGSATSVTIALTRPDTTSEFTATNVIIVPVPPVDP